jgi:hypothetical protein
MCCLFCCTVVQSFLKGETPILADEAFHNAVQSYTDVYLRSERVLRAVSTGGLSSQDFRDVFRLSVERRVRSLPDIDGLSKETVLTSWMVKFDAIFKGVGEDDSRRPGGGGPRSQQQQQQALQNQSLLHSEQPLPKEQLYDLFQQILGVKKFEHQLLFNALQVRHNLLCILTRVRHADVVIKKKQQKILNPVFFFLSFQIFHFVLSF